MMSRLNVFKESAREAVNFRKEHNTVIMPICLEI